MFLKNFTPHWFKTVNLLTFIIDKRTAFCVLTKFLPLFNGFLISTAFVPAYKYRITPRRGTLSSHFFYNTGITHEKTKAFFLTRAIVRKKKKTVRWTNTVCKTSYQTIHFFFNQTMARSYGANNRLKNRTSIQDFNSRVLWEQHLCWLYYKGKLDLKEKGEAGGNFDPDNSPCNINNWQLSGNIQTYIKKSQWRHRAAVSHSYHFIMFSFSCCY